MSARKRILLAESREVTRGVVESALRKNGYEVIAVTTSEKAKEVLNFTRPDLLVVSADIDGDDNKPLYAQLQKDVSAGQLPLLVLDTSEGRSVDFPDEVIIRLPVDPPEFIERVKVFLLPHSSDKPDKTNPLHSSDVDDDFLDAALGLDQLDVTNSEVMDKTTVHSSKRSKPVKEEEMVGFTSNSDESDVTDRTKVESLTIDQDESQITHKQARESQPESSSGTGGLELSEDAFGLINPDSIKRKSTDNPDDYNSFLDSLREDSTAEGNVTGQSQEDSGSLSIKANSSHVDPVVSVPSDKGSPDRSKRERSASDSGGVERFIDEFKKEIEQMRSTEGTGAGEAAMTDKKGIEDSSLDWRDRIESLDEQQVGFFVRRFSVELAERIAAKMVAKIDSQKLLELLKSSIVDEARKLSH